MSTSLLLHLFPLLAFNALEITGFYTATWYKQIDPKRHEPEEDTKEVLWWVKYYSLKTFGTYWSKPICTCPPCMASLHSLWFWVFHSFTLQTVVIYIFYVFALCGVMKMIAVKFDL
jgi:hypothetical protein